MITSALISQCRREYGDIPKSTQVSRAADGNATLFNLGRYPVVEGSYTIRFGTSAKTEGTHFTLDKDNGDLLTISTQSNGVIVQSNHKFANFRDANWNEAINHGIEALNARGFFKQVVRNTDVFRISANVRVYSAPSACVDAYELIKFSDRTISGSYIPMGINWQYDQDANKIVLKSKPSVAERAAMSYLRNLQTYSATSATLDVLTDWVELVKLKAGAYYFRHMAAKIAQQGNATIDEGHFSFTNARTMANDLEADFERLAARKKPTRPAMEIQYHIPGGGR